MSEHTNEPTVKHICVAIDADTSAECIYTNGKAWASRGEWTVYATDIAEAAGDGVIRFEHRLVNCPRGKCAEYPDEETLAWPDSLDALEVAQ